MGYNKGCNNRVSSTGNSGRCWGRSNNRSSRISKGINEAHLSSKQILQIQQIKQGLSQQQEQGSISTQYGKTRRAPQPWRQRQRWAPSTSP